MKKIEQIELNLDERALLASTCLDQEELMAKDDKQRLECRENAGRLAESIIARNAIPKTRWAYFTDPDMFIGGRGKSHKQIFEPRGTRGKDILRQPDFLKYLRYFIYGPDLPKDTIEGFCQIIEEDRGTSGMVLDQIKAFVRKAVRDKKLDRPRAAEEFFKLAHEIGKPEWAESVRSAAMSTR